MQFPATNNEAEYEALLTSLGLVNALEAKAFIVQANSQLVKGDYEAKEERMQKYLKIVQYGSRTDGLSSQNI